jgi:glycosyltransferase involved in cell wall biosynthesis
MAAKRLFVCIVDKILVHCESATGTITDRLHTNTEQIEVVPHAHYIDYYENTVSSTEARKSLDIPSNKTVYTFFGQIREYKQVPVLIRAFLDGDYDDSVLLIAGNPLNENIHSQINRLCRQSDDIKTQLSFISGENIQRYMNASDFIVLPFSDILTSGSAILSMSFGNAVIAPKEGCIENLLNQQEELLFKGDDLRRELIEKITLSRDLDDEKIGAMNKQKIQQFTWEMMARKTAQVYKEVRS